MGDRLAKSELPVAVVPGSLPPQNATHTRWTSANKVKADISCVLEFLNRPACASAKAFLLDDDPAANVHILTSPIAVSHAVAVQYSEVRYADGVEVFVGSSVGLLVPAFSCNSDPQSQSDAASISCGVFVVYNTCSNDMISAMGPLHVGRFIMDCNTRERVEFVRHTTTASGPKTCHVQYVYAESTTRCRMACASCESGLMVKAIQENDRSLLEACVGMSVSGALLSSCIQCGAAHGACCGCQFPNVIPSHPLDFQKIAPAISRYAGTFRGTVGTVFNRFMIRRTLDCVRRFVYQLSKMQDVDELELFTPITLTNLAITMEFPSQQESSPGLVQAGLNDALLSVNLIRSTPGSCSHDDDDNQIVVRRARMIRTIMDGVPSWKTLVSSASDSPPLDTCADIPDVRAQKRLARQERNRKAAARANAKRREARIARNAEFEYLTNRVEELRAKEEALRMENASLRFSLRGQLKDKYSQTVQ